MKSKGYVFISHSSKDILKVRNIRNTIENEGANPILFYLKCLDNDSPNSEEEALLKALISKEIKARRKFILCESKHTQRGKSKYIDWEIDEVNKLKEEEPNLIQIEKINIETYSEVEYIAKVKDFVFKQDKIIVIGAYEDSCKCYEIVGHLRQNGFDVTTHVESGDIRTDLAYKYGQATKEYIKGFAAQIGVKGIAVIIRSETSVNNSYLQMACYILSRTTCFPIFINVTDGLNPSSLNELLNDINTHILS